MRKRWYKFHDDEFKKSHQLLIREVSRIQAIYALMRLFPQYQECDYDYLYDRMRLFRSNLLRKVSHNNREGKPSQKARSEHYPLPKRPKGKYDK